MPVTIRDVAKQLNLSITTVSRALDGYSDVAEETRQQVIRVAREMGYVPNRAARQLRRQRTDTVSYKYVEQTTFLGGFKIIYPGP
jgi:DNA-binding LacI/PurR family transcriptional regulator